MINTIIVEDETRSRLLLKDMLKDNFPEICVLAEAEDVNTAKQAIETVRPQLVFMDIELKNGNSIDMLNQIGNIDFEIIFTTAFDSYALKAFKFCAIDYLLKPIGLEEFKDAVKRAQKRIEKNAVVGYLDVMMQNMKNTNFAEHQIALPTTEGLMFVKVNDILYCEGDGAYTHVILRNQKKIMTSRYLKEFETMLAEYHFCRIHHSHLINLNEIQKYVRGEGGYVIMNDGVMLDVAKRKKEFFLNSFSRI